LASCSAVAILQFLIFEQRVPNFHFAQGSAKHVAGPVLIPAPCPPKNQITVKYDPGGVRSFDLLSHRCVNILVMKGILKIMKNTLTIPFVNKKIIEFI